MQRGNENGKRRFLKSLKIITSLENIVWVLVFSVRPANFVSHYQEPTRGDVALLLELYGLAFNFETRRRPTKRRGVSAAVARWRK